MGNPPGVTPEPETGVDRFSHEIEELEQSFWQENKNQFLIALSIAIGAAALILVGFLIVGGSGQRPEAGATTIATVDLGEPLGRLSERPALFRWESISGAPMYVLKIMERGSERPLIERTVTTNLVRLEPDEAARIVKGGSYVWRVEARSGEKWLVGQGEGAFTY